MSDENVIETVRGRIDAALSEDLLAFWGREAGFTGDDARLRLPEVVCVLRRHGALVGTSSAFPAEVPLVAGWRFWVFRSLLPGRAAEHWQAMVRATFAALDSEHAPASEAPVGLCVLVDEAERRRHPEAEWAYPRMIHAGYLDDGRQVRIAYFSAEVSSMYAPTPPGTPLPESGFRIVALSEQDTVTPQDVIRLWTDEAGLDRSEAERRVSELQHLGIDGAGRLAGVSTAYLARHPQLRADAWHYRTFVAPAQRWSNLAVSLVVASREQLERRYISGTDRRGIGFVFEVENPGLNRRFPRGLWLESDVLFVGLNAHGAHVRVHYFPGALSPEP